VELIEGLHPLAAVLRRYSYAYTAAHDFRVCSEIMVDDYVLRMGEHEIRGRDAEYIPATRKQYRQYRGLGFTVHELVLGEDRAALHFTEHGRSAVHGGGAAWSGVSMYRWDGRRLIECRVEQDYYGRRTQQRTARANPILSPGLDPWTAHPAETDPDTESVVRTWLAAGGLGDAPIGSLDDEHAAPARRMLLSQPRTTVLDLFSAGDRVAFHVLLHGTYAGGLDRLDGYRHQPAALYVTGLATVRYGQVTDIRAITDRLAAERRLDGQRGRN
jgi:hypothetical protein